MLPAPIGYREQIRWFVAGRPLAGDEWICTQYVGRGRPALAGEETVHWEARMSLPAFEGIYGPVFEDERRALAVAKEDLTPAEHRLCAAGCPGMLDLLERDTGLLRDFVVEADCDLLERMWMDERPARRLGYAVQRVVDLRCAGAEIWIAGLAVRATGEKSCTN